MTTSTGSSEEIVIAIEETNQLDENKQYNTNTSSILLIPQTSAKVVVKRVKQGGLFSYGNKEDKQIHKKPEQPEKQKSVAEVIEDDSLLSSLEDLNKRIITTPEEVTKEYRTEQTSSEPTQESKHDVTVSGINYFDQNDPPQPYNEDSENAGVPSRQIYVFPVRLNPDNTVYNYDPDYLWCYDDRFENDFKELHIRNKFIAKVFLILSIQNFLGLLFGLLCFYSTNVGYFVSKYNGVFIIATLILLIVESVLICATTTRRMFPYNYILLGILTLAFVYTIGGLSVYYSKDTVLPPVGIMAVLLTIISFFARTDMFDTASWAFIIFMLSLLTLGYGILAIVLLSTTQGFSLFYTLIYIGLFGFTLFLLYDIQLILSKGTYTLTQDEYIFAILTLYSDIIMLYCHCLRLVDR